MATAGDIELIGEPAWSRKRRIGHYGGALDKRACTTERAPYAHTWWRSLQTYRGSAYTKTAGTLVDVENVAIARLFAGLSRTAEKLQCNANPLTAYERLGYWVEVQAVPVLPEDTHQDIRVRCAAKYGSAQGPTEYAIDTAVEKLLGPNLVRTWRFRGNDLADPAAVAPIPTYWPGVNPGPSDHDLGGGTWSSPRCKLTVEVRQLPGQSDREWKQLARRALTDLLDRELDSHATFTAGTGVGFTVGLSRLGYDLLGP